MAARHRRTTEESRSFAGAAIRELTDLQAAALKCKADFQSWSEIEGALREGLPAVEKLAEQKKLPAVQNLAAVQKATDSEKLAGIKELASGAKLLTNGRAGQIARQVEQLREVLRGAGFEGSPVLDDFTKTWGEKEWNSIEEGLAEVFGENPELAGRLFENANWPFPIAQWEHVRAAEVREINALRARRGLEQEYESRWLGLAFSGGGIRSATFNLGVLQGLAKQKLLEKVDILSTVSGGGYIGAWLAAWIKRESIGLVSDQLAASGSLDGQHKFGEAPDRDEQSPPAISFLRQFSNYLTPNLGFFSIDTWTVVAVYLRNVVLNQITLAAIIGAIMLLPRFAVLPYMQAAGDATTWVHNELVGVALVLVAVSVALVSFNLRRVTAGPSENDRKKDDSSWWRQLNSLGEVGVQAGCVALMIVGVLLGSIWFWLNIGNDNLQSINTHMFWRLAAGFFFILSLLITVFGGSFKCVKSRLEQKKHKTAGFVFQGGLLYLAMLASSGVALALLRGYLAILSGFHADPQSGPWHAVVWSPVLLMLVPGTAAILHVGLLGIYIQDVGREWLTRFRAITHLWLFFWSALGCAEVYGPLLLAKLGLWISGILSVGWIVSTVTSLRAGQSVRSGKDQDDKSGSSVLDIVAKIGPPIFLVGFLLFIAFAEHLFLSYQKGGACPFTLRDMVDHYWEWLHPFPMWWSDSPWPFAAPGTLFVLLAVTGLILAWRVDINEFSMHHFYKNRLVRCYLGASNRERDANRFTGFDPKDEFSLCELKAAKGYTGPYHIINATLNLSAGEDLAWQERKGASFIFTPAYCGFDLSLERGSHGRKQKDDKLASCAYRETRNYGYPQGVPLGTAVAISGAAADPNQGFSTSPTVAFLMTVFDVRLGWWLGNPRRNVESTLPGPRFGLASLVSELLGRTDDQTRFVSLADGGKFDNMGLYELVRRRCRYIILCDGEQDGDYTFEGLGMAIRKCRIDFGVQIEIDPRPIVPSGDPKRSEAHCAVGTIRYNDETEGTLLYIKASLTGDEPRDVLQYAATATTFPQQTTADQWFGESQFESYRALGYQALNAAIEPAKIWTGAEGTADVEALFTEGLRSCWYPPNPGLRENAIKHTGALSQLLARISSDEDLHEIGHKLFSVHPEFGPGGVHSPEEFYFVMILLQMVEDIYFDFELNKGDWRKDPRIGGWMKLFEHWANAKIVKDVWESKRDTFRKDFQNFWDTVGKEGGAEWRRIAREQTAADERVSKGAGGS